MASESCALASVGAKFERDVLPGEILVFDDSGVRPDRIHCGKKERRICVFEYIYFARPDSVIDQVRIKLNPALVHQKPARLMILKSPCKGRVLNI